MRPMLPDPPSTRRALLRGALALGGAAAFRPAWSSCRGDEAAGPDLIVRSSRPLDAETPTEVFDRWLTPNRLFFVRSHFDAPAVGPGPWRLTVGGEVERPRQFDLEQLGEFETVTVPAVLQCSGNGRAFFEPKIPGVGWERGAVGNAEWTGVRLKDLLDRAGLKRGAAHVHLLGSDAPPAPRTPAFLRSIPLARALDPSTLVATRMNGEPLPRLHGGPLRLVVPGWAGNHWIKWLRSITVARDEAPGFYMQTAYRMPKVPAPPGAELKPTDLEPVTTLNVKSLFARPTPGAVLPAGRVGVRGVAWTGRGRVARVEVAIDGGDWQTATCEGPDREFAWRLWRLDWEARPGRHELRVRATDDAGRVQPETTPWNRSGYLWNGIDRVRCEVT